MLSKYILPLLLTASTSHAFGPYARQLKNITVAATGTASISLSLSTGIGSSSSGASTVTASSLSGFLSISNLSSMSTGDPSPTGAGSSSLEESSTPSSSASFSDDGASNTLPSKPSSTVSFSVDSASNTLLPSSTSAAIVPITIKATDGSQQSTVVTWSAIETRSTSTTDNNGQPTAISPPFYECDDPLCISTGCVLAILCLSGSGKAGFGGFPPPSPPPGPPPGSINRPSGSASQSLLTTDSASVRSTISSSTSTTSSTTCGSISTVMDPGPSSVGDPDDDSRRRVRRGTLVPREAPVVSRIGSCPLATNVNIPSFLSYTAAMNLGKQPNANNGANGKIYNAIEKWYVENLAIDGSSFSGEKQNHNFTTATGPGSTDHVWEKSNLGDFLAYLLQSELDCDDINALFSSSCSGINLWQQIFNQLPSMDPKNMQSGFAAMNRQLNGMKGWMFSQGYSDHRFNKIYSTNEQIVQGLQRQAIIFNLFNTDSGIQSMHDQTNNRIYQAFLGLDDYISRNKIQRAKSRGTYTLQFGPAFKTWYGQLLSNTGSAAYAWASKKLLDVEKDPSISDCLKKAISAFQSSPLYGEDKFRIDQSHLSWDASPLVLFKRDGACAATMKLSATLVPSTTLSIATSQKAVSSSTPSSVTTSSLPSKPSSSAAFSSIAAILSVTSFTRPTTSPPSASVSIASSTCIANQVQGSCISGKLPSAAPYSGEQGPSCDKAAGPGSPDSRINIRQAEKGARKYCAALAQSGVILSAESAPPKPFIVPDAAENHQDLVFSIVFDISACPQDKSNSTLDFKKLGVHECQADLFGAVSTFCVQDYTWEDYNSQYTLEGGSFGNDCALWALYAQPK